MFDVVPLAQDSVGLACYGDEFYVAQVGLDKNSLRINSLVRVRETLDLHHLLQKAKEVTGDIQLVTAVESSKLMIRQFSLPLCKEKDIEKAIPFQIDSSIPFLSEESCFYWKCTEQTNGLSQVVVQIGKKVDIENQISYWKNLKVHSDVVSSEAQALACFSSHCFKDKNEQTIFIVHFFEDTALCVLVKGSTVLEQCSFKLDSLAKVETEVVRAFLSLNRKGSYDVKFITVTGKAFDETWKRTVANRLKIDFINPKPLNGIDSIAKMNEFAVPIGLALIGIDNDVNAINFRTGSLSSPNTIFRLLKKSAPLFISSLILFCSLFFSLMESKKNLTNKLYIEHLTLLELIEQESLGKEEEIKINKNFKVGSVAEIRKTLFEVRKRKNNKVFSYPLEGNIPKISDFLAWLNSYEASLNEEVKLENIHYTLLKRPSQSQPNSPYQVRVEVLISADNTKTAHGFYEFLRSDKLFVDMSTPIKWSSVENKYKAVFYLQDRTLYQT